LYRRNCNFSGETVVSIYRNDAPFPVYKQEVWRGDKWDPLSYGRNFDFNRSFFEQYEKLRRVVPHLALANSNSVNSEYSNQSQDNKDCYMVSATGGSEKCMYGNWFQPGSYFSADCYMIEKSEFCYECINCGRCSRCVWCQDCFDCVALNFSIDCRGCSNCFGCVGFRNKQCAWFNKQLSQGEYEQRLKAFDWSRGEILKAIEETKRLSLVLPRKNYHGAKVQNSSGDYLENATNARFSFNCRENKDTAYLQDAWQMVDALDETEILKDERSYELQGCAFTNRCIVLRSCWTMTDCYYCDMCFSCSDCLGCFGLKQKQYCILNKQYSREDYLELKKRIIEHMKKTSEWGEYFPAELSPFAYNESVAQDYFPLTKKEAIARSYEWYDHQESKDYKPTMRPSDVPKFISETTDSILNEVIGCSSQESEKERDLHPECATAFRVIPLELSLYRKLGISLPSKCFPCRRNDRFALRNPRKLWHRQCTCAGEKSENGVYQNTASHFHGAGQCPNEFETSYSPERKEIVYCEQCYNAEVV